MSPVRSDAQLSGNVIRIGPVDGVVDAPEPLCVVALGYGEVEDSFHVWVTETNVELFERLRELATGAPREEKRLIAVLVTEPPGGRANPDAVAAVESVRGAVLSLAVELGPAVRLNIVVARQAADAAQVLRYLASPDADYVTGSTFDLRETA
ncbi:hypothetical protein [Streptomyces rugosispiralis]|uniref:Uncharacterized protein n=1 Tax=Streptomyces rugosispiralis TaxID=2967341 RepID=A0ABT1US28_9ACTN|nr:hypothetical protein [Streptomyces rugosispiralis]MCQ8187806.1 hypothetical protein [Streptomyces rugosispiralis]